MADQGEIGVYTPVINGIGASDDRPNAPRLVSVRVMEKIAPTRVVVDVEWIAEDLSDVPEYQVSVVLPSGKRQRIETSQRNRCDIALSDFGAYRIEVRARGAGNVLSLPVAETIVYSDESVEDPDTSGRLWEAIGADATARAQAAIATFTETEFVPATARIASLEDSTANAEHHLANAVSDMDRLAAASAAVVARLSGAETRMFDAGIKVDPETGQVTIEGVARLDGQMFSVGQRIAAAEGLLELKATMVQVNQAIASAQLTPTELAALDDVWTQINEVSLAVDALNASLELKASTASVQGVQAELTTATQAIDALQQEIATKVESTVLDGLQASLTGVQQTLSTIDVPTVVQSVYELELLRDEVDRIAQESIWATLTRLQENEFQAQRLAAARSELQAGIDAEGTARASDKTELGVQIGNVQAYSEQSRQISADADTARGVQIDAFQAETAGSMASFGSALNLVATQSNNQASQIATLSSTLDDQSATVTQHSQAIAGLGASIQFYINSNGHIAGYALSSEISEDGTPWSSFVVVADQFQISGVGGAFSPFVVYTQETIIDGVTVSPGTYILDATIRQGLISKLRFGERIQSVDYVAGQTGVLLDFINGFCELNDVVLSRDQIIRSGVYSARLW
ncbi:DUF1983 domain-containing protein [Cochlodiniinecator piscidefendens]|uniref:DUF1983 domain-containing protein n=1 Tax=Cochlodiniinecator piscidefendens TaxID=2715756 RepID=UPI00140C89A2|nr:DUF1983 domain-containing protein [Cochlodiniinecator piscidefendens]